MRKLTSVALILLLCITLLPTIDPSVGGSPDGSGRIQKMSICYSGRIHNTVVQQYIAKHFDLVDTELSTSAAAHIQWIKNNAVNTDFKAIGYYESIFSDNTASDWSIVNSHEEWFMHTITGSRIERDTSTGYVGQFLMNPNSGWNNYIVTRCENAQISYPMYDGVFMDDYAGDLESTAYGPYNFMDANTHRTIPFPYQGKFGDGYSRTNWGTWMTGYSAHLKTTIGNDMVMVNCHIDTSLGSIAGAMLWEGFVHSRSSSYSSNGYSPSSIFLAVDKLHEQALQGKIITTNGGCFGGSASQKEEWAKFCYAALSFSVVDQTKAYFSWEFMSSDPSATPSWYPWMDMTLGMPIDDYHQIANPYIYAREFENYYVVANLDNLGTGAVPFTIDGHAYSLDGKKALFIEKDTWYLPGQTFYVSSTGSDSNPGTLAQPWRTIQKASYNAGSGDIVYIRGGTYNEKVTFSAARTSWTTFSSYGNERVIVSGQGIYGDYDGVLHFKNGCRYIRITGLEITDASYAGVFLSGGAIQNIRIDNCTIHNCQSSGIYAYSSQYGAGVYVKNIEFDHNIVYDVNNGNDYNLGGYSAQEAISFSGVIGFNIHHNTLWAFGKEGIDLKSGSSNGRVHHNTIDTSLESPSFQWDYNHIGIYVDGYTRMNQNIRLYCNSITGYGGSGIVLNAEHPESGGGIQDIYVYNNVINLSVLPGHAHYRSLDSLNDCPWTNVYIYSNTFYNRESRNPPRIFPSASHLYNLVIQNNIFAGASSASISFQNTASTEVAGRITLANNLFYRFSGPAHNQWKDGADKYWGIQSVLNDPKFTSSDNLHLQDGSPAIDTGAPVNVSFDFDGNARPYGAGYDIGAFEYHIPFVFLSVTTESATMVTNQSATLNGILGNGGMLPAGCAVWFDYGTTTSYGMTTAIQIKATGQGFSQNIICVLSTTYHYRAVAFDGATYAYGSDFLFTTEMNSTMIQPPRNLHANWTTNSSITLTWIQGYGSTKTCIVRKNDSFPTDVSDGIVIYRGVGCSYNDTGLTSSSRYYYHAYSYGAGQYSIGVGFTLASTENSCSYGSSWANLSGYLITDTSAQAFFSYATTQEFETPPQNITRQTELYEQSTSYPYNFYGSHWVGQTFRVGTTGTNQGFTIHTVSFKMSRIYHPGLVSVSLFNVNETGLPTGPILASGSIDGETVPYNRTWVNITMSPYHLAANTQYAVVMKVPGSSSDYLYLWEDHVAPAYSGGSLIISHDDGMTFSGLSADALFRIWGDISVIPTIHHSTVTTMTTSGYYNITQTNLSQGQMYWFYLAVKDINGNITKGGVRYLLTNPAEPTFLSIRPVFTNNSVLVSWRKGQGANRTILVRGDMEYSKMSSEGTVLYDGTETSFWVRNVNFNSPSYFSLVSVTTWGNHMRYSAMTPIPWKIITIMVYDDGITLPLTGFDLLVSTRAVDAGLVNDTIKPYVVNGTDVPYGEYIPFSVNSDSNQTKVYTMKVPPSIEVLLKFYLASPVPPETSSFTIWTIDQAGDPLSDSQAVIEQYLSGGYGLVTGGLLDDHVVLILVFSH